MNPIHRPQEALGMLKTARYVVLGGVSLLALSAPVGVLGAGSTASSAPVALKAVHPQFAVLHSPRSRTIPLMGAGTWTYSYTYLGTGYSDTFVGTDPTGGGSTTVPTYIIPIKLTLGGFTADPKHVLSNGKTVIKNTTASPIFGKLKYVQGGTNVGKTQYIDAFQRAALWGTVSAHPTYHVLLGKPIVKPEQTVAVPTSQGGLYTLNGGTEEIIVANINWFDPVAQGLISSLGIPSNALPIFITTETYLSNNSGSTGCCIGGYHNVSGSGLPYAMFTYMQVAADFSQDVSALSHEIGEYVDDPNTNNFDVPAACSSNPIYEVGDPLEGEANYGTYPYALNAFTYHLQDLVTPEYFGAPTSTSVHGWSTFQGTTIGICANGG
jgi:hypothetical protein